MENLFAILLSGILKLNYAAILFISSLLILFAVFAVKPKKKNVLVKRKASSNAKSYLDTQLDKIKWLVRSEKDFDDRVSILDFKYTGRHITKLNIINTFIAISVSMLLQNIFSLIPLIILLNYIPRNFIENRVDRKVRHIGSQVLKAMDMISNSIATTKSVKLTYTTIIPDLENPLKSEFERLVRTLNSGEDVEKAYMEFATRTQNKWLTMFARLMILQSKEGGDVSKPLADITDNIRSETILKQLNKTELSGLILTNTILNLAAIGIYVYNAILFPENNQIFHDTTGGRIVITVVIVSVIVSTYLSRRLAKGR